jgi:tetratricopeptide (TPR) repeat protein
MTRLIFYSLLLGLLSCGNRDDSNRKVGKNQPDSLSILQESLQQNPLQPPVWLQLAQKQLLNGDTVGGIHSLESYLQQIPENASARLELAWLLADQKNSKALTQTDTLVLAGDPEAALRGLLIRAIYYGNIGVKDTAILLLDRIIIENHQFIDAYIEKGILLYDQQKYAEALTTFQQGLRVDPAEAELYYWISSSFRALGQKPEADDWARKYEALK